MKGGPFLPLISPDFTTGSFAGRRTACQAARNRHATYGVPLPYQPAPKLFANRLRTASNAPVKSKLKPTPNSSLDVTDNSMV